MPNISTVLSKVNKYALPITLTENSGSTLTDQQVLIKLDSSFTGWDMINSDGSNIWFETEDWEPIYFWIEKIDTANKIAYIWVKVPSIPASSQTVINMCWGETNSYKAYHSGSGVFLFFDDLNSWSGWSNYGTGAVSHDTSTYFYGTGSLEKITNCDPNGGYKALGITIDRTSGSYALMYRARRGNGSGTDCYADRVGLEASSNWNGYSFNLGHSTGGTAQLSIDKRTSGSATVQGSTSLPSGNNATDIWYVAELVLTSSSVIATLYDENYNKIVSTSSTDTAYTTFDTFVVRGGRPYNVDVPRVMKYVSSPPGVSFGSWEYIGKIRIGFY